MKIIGLIGGMSWESSKVYYEIINKKVNELSGGFHSCKCIMYSVDFAEVEKLQSENKWKELGSLMADSAERLERAGADMIILCTNTMHLCSEAIVNNIAVPFLHIAEAIGEEIVKKNIKKVGLLGTKYTMEKDFYRVVLKKKFGIETIIPDEPERNFIHSTIYNELVHGIIKEESREKFKTIINRLHEKGAEGIILGCTEIPLLISDKDVSVPLFNSTKIHAEKAVEWAIGNK